MADQSPATSSEPKEESKTQPVRENTIEFISSVATSKLRVKCDGVKEKGSDRVLVAQTQASNCSVVAILTNRKRKVATIKNVSTGRYICFQEEKGSCSREK